MEENDELLTDQEMEKIVLVMLHTSDKGCSKEEMLAIVNWARGVRMDNAMLELVLNGRVKVIADKTEDGYEPRLILGDDAWAERVINAFRKVK